MDQRAWPTREEWAAKAEYSVRTFCTMYERLPEDATFITPDEEAEAQRLGQSLATRVRPLLNAEITRLKALLPDRPKPSRARVDWILALDNGRYETACDLAALEEIRRDIARSAKTAAWGGIRWELGRINRSYRAINLNDLLYDLHVLDTIATAVDERRTAEAKRLEDEAVAQRIAYRKTDEAWAKELERRARIDAGPVIARH